MSTDIGKCVDADGERPERLDSRAAIGRVPANVRPTCEQLTATTQGRGVPSAMRPEWRQLSPADQAGLRALRRLPSESALRLQRPPAGALYRRKTPHRGPYGWGNGMLFCAITVRSFAG